MPHTFISYAREDGEFALQLAQALRDAGVETWIDQLDIPTGARWDRAVQHALETCERFLIILSPDSVDSENVQDEIAVALNENKIIVPVRYRECKKLMRLSRLHYIDFTGEFQLALQKLLANLIASSRGNKQTQPQSLAQSDPKIIIPPEGMVLIPAGWFLMGSEKREEEKVHKVYVNAFYLDRHQVTVEQYQAFLLAAKHWESPKHWDEQLDNPKWPVVLLTWEDARQYAKWADKRLPNEAEWEYAARGGMTGFGGQPIYKFPWGNEAKASHANFSESGSRTDYSWENAKRYLKNVGSYSPNGYGLYDMSGNVWEWCSDWLDGPYYKQSPEHNPQGPKVGKECVLRGGSWFDGADEVRCAHRGKFAPHDKRSNVGFRCVKDIS